jgi:Lon protease-like protein
MHILPLFPLNTVLFPTMPLNLYIFEDRYKQMISRCLAEDLPFGVLLIREGVEVGGPAVPVEMGSTARITSVDKLREGRMNLAATGQKRFRLLEITQTKPYLLGRVEFVPQQLEGRDSLQIAAASLRRLFAEYLNAAATLAQDVQVPELPAGAVELAYTIAAALPVDNQVKQSLLETPFLEQLLLAESGLLHKEISRLKILVELGKQDKTSALTKIGPFSVN